jgi:hypothetical protein
MEILIAAAVGAVVIGAAVVVIAPALQGSRSAEERQTITGLGKELLENVRAVSESDWHNIDSLAEGSGNHYHLDTSISPFVPISGDETIAMGAGSSAQTYKRYFYMEPAMRTSGDLDSGGATLDPSTRKIIVVFGKIGGTMHSIEGYITRSQNNPFVQTDWVGGTWADGLVPVDNPGTKFASSSGNINYASSTGAIFLNLE